MNQTKFKDIIDKYLSGNANEQEKQLIDRWYKKLEKEEIYPTGINENLHVRLLTNINRVIAARNKKVKKFSIKHIGLLKIAASFFLVTIIALYFYNNYKNVKWTNVVAKKGEIKKLVLEDSSIVWLNASTSLKYNDKFNQRKREIWLDGEAYFDVKHDKAKPFIIHTRNLETHVLGTAFNINGYSYNEVVVSVTRGKVGLTKERGESVFLVANEQASYTVDSQDIKKSKADALSTAAWIKGESVFKEMRFGEIAERLERKFDAKISFSSENIKNCLLTASFRKDATLKEILTILSEIDNCNLINDTEKNSYLISGSGCN